MVIQCPMHAAVGEQMTYRNLCARNVSRIVDGCVGYPTPVVRNEAYYSIRDIGANFYRATIPVIELYVPGL